MTQITFTDPEEPSNLIRVTVEPYGRIRLDTEFVSIYVDRFLARPMAQAIVDITKNDGKHPVDTHIEP